MLGTRVIQLQRPFECVCVYVCWFGSDLYRTRAVALLGEPSALPGCNEFHEDWVSLLQMETNRVSNLMKNRNIEAQAFSDAEDESQTTPPPATSPMPRRGSIAPDEGRHFPSSSPAAMSREHYIHDLLGLIIIELLINSEQQWMWRFHPRLPLKGGLPYAHKPWLRLKTLFAPKLLNEPYTSYSIWMKPWFILLLEGSKYVGCGDSFR